MKTYRVTQTYLPIKEDGINDIDTLLDNATLEHATQMFDYSDSHPSVTIELIEIDEEANTAVVINSK